MQSSRANKFPGTPIVSTPIGKAAKDNSRSPSVADPDAPELMALQPTMNIGMIGHVAHGKSTITRALSNVATGKFREEEEKNMTIKLGYANVKIYKCQNAMCPVPWCYQATGGSQMGLLPCKRPGCKGQAALVRHFSFVDAPGHHDLLTTMLSGAAVMHGALLVVAADEQCPCPQTAEHVAAAELAGFLHNTVVVQNKVDLCSTERCLDSRDEIMDFLQDTPAAKAPIVPLAAQLGLNLDALCHTLVERFPLPKADKALAGPARMLVVRSFDINRPGPIKDAKNIKGGVLGGSIVQGCLRVGQQVEVRPGVVHADGSHTPVITTVTSLLSESTKLSMAVPGGLIALGLEADPSLTRADKLVGHVVGDVGTLPPVFRECTITYRRLPSLHASSSSSSSLSSETTRFKAGQKVLLCLGSHRTEATIVAKWKEKQVGQDAEQEEEEEKENEDNEATKRGSNKDKQKDNGTQKDKKLSKLRLLSLQLRLPLCADLNSTGTLFISEKGASIRWRLAAAATLHSISEQAPADVSHLSVEASNEQSKTVANRNSNDLDPEQSCIDQGETKDEKSDASFSIEPRNKSQADSDADESDSQSGSSEEEEDEAIGTGGQKAQQALSQIAWPEQPAVSEPSVDSASAAEETREESDADNEDNEDNEEAFLAAKKLPFYAHALPKVGDLVVVKVTSVNEEVGAYVALCEYGQQQALIPLIELTKRGRMPLAQQLVGKEEVCAVLRVDAARGFVDLSKRRVTEEEADALRTRYRHSRLLHSLLSRVSELSGLPFPVFLRNIAWPLYALYPTPAHPIDALYEALHDPAPLYAQLRIPEWVQPIFIKTLRRRLQPKPVVASARVRLECFSNPGVEALRRALAVIVPKAAVVPKKPKGGKQAAGAKPEPSPTVQNEVDTAPPALRVCLVGSPEYSLSAEHVDRVLALDVVTKAASALATALKAAGGRFFYIAAPSVSGVAHGTVMTAEARE